MHVSLKVVTKGPIKGKKETPKFRFLGCFSSEKTEECKKNVEIFFDQFGIIIPCSCTYFLEVGACLSLKVATKGSIRDEKDSEKLYF